MEPNINLHPDEDDEVIKQRKASEPAPLNDVSPALSETMISEYKTLLYNLLYRIENSTTHYHVLGLNPSTTYDEIVGAFNLTLKLLYPPHQIRIAFDEQVSERIENAFNKASLAFATLSSFKKRFEYHNSGLTITAATSPAPSVARPGQQLANESTATTLQALHTARRVTTGALRLVTTPSPQAADKDLEIPSNITETKQSTTEQLYSIYSEAAGTPGPKVVYSEFAVENTDENRRRTHRFKLSLPVRLTGYDKSGAKWYEMTESINVSRTGVTIYLQRNVRYGNVFYLSLPLPGKLRSHGYNDASYNVYAIVRRIEPERGGKRTIALEFIGEYPPKGYTEKPWAIFRSQRWSGRERQLSPRINRQECIHLEYYDSSARMVAREETITENISFTGMRIFAKFAPVEFDLVRISCLSRDFESLAIVRNRYIAKDGIERLCVQFINRKESD